MKKTICFLYIISITLWFASCGKIEVSSTDFMAFSEKCNATEYYSSVERYSDKAEIVSYSIKSEIYIIFQTKTMLEKCIYNQDSYDNVEKEIDLNQNFIKKFTKCKIEDNEVDVYFTNDEIEKTKKNFGFILMCSKEKEIDYCWFSDEDYDNALTSEKEFLKFFEENFKIYTN